jgi:hypothetical protein
MNTTEDDSKGTILVDFLTGFYKQNSSQKNKSKMNIFHDIISQKTQLSLRLLDWLVTNYAKKYNIVYPISKNGEKEYFNIYLSYKNQLKAYSKKYFDPFCRRDRIIINVRDLSWKKYLNEKYNKDDYVVTTVGQLNFFKWFIENKVILYAINNIELIDEDMNVTLQSNKNCKRRELSASAIKGVYTSPNRVIVKFD